jgi:hydroxyethylthiazole kinase-like sugar kinase family protein
MTKTFTKNDLILFIYNEIRQDFKNDLRHALSSDPLMDEDYRELKETQLSLPKVLFKPSAKSLQKIRAYMATVI